MSKRGRNWRKAVTRGPARNPSRRHSRAQDGVLERYIIKSPQFVFLIDTALNTVVFLTIAGLGAALSALVDAMEARNVSRTIVVCVQGAEYLLFFSDIVWFVVFLGISTYRALVNLLKGERQ